MSKRCNLVVDRWLSEISDKLMRDILNDTSKECMLSGAMSIGKTTFLIDTLAPKVKEMGNTWLVFVLPGVVQLLQLNEKGIPIVCDGRNCTDEWFTGTTPDSLHKIMDRAKELNKNVWLVVDEAHAMATNSLFRKSFLNIRRYVEQCSKVIYMTATPQPLEGIDMGSVYEIKRRNSPNVPISIQLVEKVNINTVYEIVASRFDNSGTVYSHWNDIDNNDTLASQLQKLCEVKQQKVLVEDHQENLLDVEPQYRVVDNTAQAVSLHASNKSHRVTQSLVKGKVPDDVGFMCMTSFVKEGLNIDNAPNSSVVIVWDKGITYAELVQTIGRYRQQENISEVIVIVQEYAKEDRRTYKPFETMLEEHRALYERLNETVNIAYSVGSDNLKLILASSCSIYDPLTDKYVLSEELYNNKLYNEYSNILRQYPELIKKAFKNEVAIKLIPSIKESQKIEDSGLNEIVKATKEEKAQAFDEIVKQIISYDDKTIEELLDYTINRRLPENKEAVENMEIYHQLASTKFKNTLSDIQQFTGSSKAEAFKRLVQTESKDIENVIADSRARATNRDIKALGIEGAQKAFRILKEKRHTKPIARQVFIRNELQNIEIKQGRLSVKRLNNLAQTMMDNGYYSGKKINLEKALEKLKQDLELIYVIKTDNKGYSFISRIKM